MDLNRKSFSSTRRNSFITKEIISRLRRSFNGIESKSIVRKFSSRTKTTNEVAECFQRNNRFLVVYFSSEFKQSARELSSDLNSRMTEEKIRRFLNRILLDQSPAKAPTIIHRSTSFFERSNPNKNAPVHIRTHEKHPKLRPQSLFITPNVLNDSSALSKLDNQRTVNFDRKYDSSSSTIDDADSTIVSLSASSLIVQQRKRSILHNSYPSLIRIGNHCNESGQELDQISNLTSKMFGSDDDEEDRRNDLRNISSTTSSSILSSTNDKFLQT